MRGDGGGGRRTRIGIVGGGIAGLAAAIALSRYNEFEVLVFERSPHPSPRGALLLWTNAIRGLAALGLEASVRAAATPIETTEVRTAAGTLLCSLPIGQWSRRVGAPTVVIARGTLLSLLLNALPTGIIRSGTAFRRYTHDGDVVTIDLEDGSMVKVDALIGADGLHSTVRAQLLGRQPLRTLSQDAWVGIASFRSPSIATGVAVATVANGPRFWFAQLSSDSVFWYATLNGDGYRSDDSGGRLSESLRGWPEPIPDLIAATPPTQIVHTRICDRPPSNRWGEGAVTLLGDAAHPTTPDLGQGACQGIESAVALASCLASAPSIPAGLRAYEKRRMTRTASINHLCWMTAINSAIEEPTLCRLRNAAIRFGLSAVARSQLDWILRGG